MPTEPVFSYSTDPQPVKPRPKYRNVSDEVGLTLMSDPRVRRGPTLALTKKLQRQQQQFAAATASPGKTRQQVLAATQGTSRDKDILNQPTYSFKVPNFISSSFDVSRYLVADEAKRSETHVTSQTDEFMPLPPPAEYVPRKTGVDASTQVEDARELFDFDAEVKPLVAVIVQKTLEQAIFEVSSEDELQSLETAINRFNVEREIAAGWILEKEQELMEEHAVKERERVAQLEVIRAELEIRRRVACAEAVRQIMPDVMSSVFDELKASGTWREQDRDDADQVQLPALYTRAAKLCESYGAAAEIVDGAYVSVVSLFVTNLFVHDVSSLPFVHV
jgi:hypothetical protein